MDVPYDKQARIQTLGVVLGNGRNTLMLACILYILLIIACVSQSLVAAAVLLIPFPVYLLYEIYRDEVSRRSVVIYCNLNYLCIYFWVTVVFLYLQVLYY